MGSVVFVRAWGIDFTTGCLVKLFMLFLGIIGGLLSYGPQGFVIGPMAVVLAYGLIRFLSGQSQPLVSKGEKPSGQSAS